MLDLVIIGAGPAGLSAAEAAAQRNALPLQRQAEFAEGDVLAAALRQRELQRGLRGDAVVVLHLERQLPAGLPGWGEAQAARRRQHLELRRAVGQGIEAVRLAGIQQAAIEFDAVMVVFGVPRVDRAGRPAAPPMPGLESVFYSVEVEDMIDPRDYADQPDAVKAITQRYTAALERLIRRHPEQYFWLHRRWKHQPKTNVKREPKAA